MTHTLPDSASGSGHIEVILFNDARPATLGSTVLAGEQKATGVVNIVDDEPAPVRDWLPYMAELVTAKKPRRVPGWLAKLLAGDMIIVMTQRRGFSNAKAKRELGWAPRYPSWRQGFKETLA